MNFYGYAKQLSEGLLSSGRSEVTEGAYFINPPGERLLLGLVPMSPRLTRLFFEG